MKKNYLYMLVAIVILFAFYPNNKKIVQKVKNPYSLEKQIKRIKTNKKWYASVKKKAKKVKRKVENQVFLDAIYMLKNNDKKYAKMLKKELKKTKKNKKKYNKIKKKAKKLKNCTKYQLYYVVHSKIEKDYIKKNKKDNH